MYMIKHCIEIFNFKTYQKRFDQRYGRIHRTNGLTRDNWRRRTFPIAYGTVITLNNDDQVFQCIHTAKGSDKRIFKRCPQQPGTYIAYLHELLSSLVNSFCCCISNSSSSGGNYLILACLKLWNCVR